MGDDAIDEEKLVLCCALCCANMSTYPSADCLGCSGKVGMCCLNAEFCCKVRLRFSPLPTSFFTCIVSDQSPLSRSPFHTMILIDVSLEHPAFPASAVDLSANATDAHASTSKHIAAAVLPRLHFHAMTKCPLP